MNDLLHSTVSSGILLDTRSHRPSPSPHSGNGGCLRRDSVHWHRDCPAMTLEHRQGQGSYTNMYSRVIYRQGLEGHTQSGTHGSYTDTHIGTQGLYRERERLNVYTQTGIQSLYTNRDSRFIHKGAQVIHTGTQRLYTDMGSRVTLCIHRHPTFLILSK